MSIELTHRRQAHLPWEVTVTGVLLLVLGLGALGGGLAMILGIGGESFLPDEYLDDLPLVDSWLVPGLILLVAMIGAIVLTLQHKRDVRRQKVSSQVGRSREEAVELVNVESGRGLS